MTILEALKHATKKAGFNTELQFASIQTFETFNNSFRFDQYPINILVPYDTTGSDVGPNRKVILLLNGWVLTQIRKDQNITREAQIEEHVIAPMRKMAVKFLRTFYQSEFIDSEAGPITDRISPVYNFTNMGLFGVSYQASVPIIENICLEENDYDAQTTCE